MHHTISIDQRGRADGALQMFATLAQSMSYVVIALLSHYQLTQYGFLIAAVVIVFATIMARLLVNKLLTTEKFLVNAGKVAIA
jgi:MFS family permease